MASTEYRRTFRDGQIVHGEQRYGDSWVRFSGWEPLMKVGFIVRFGDAEVAHRIWQLQDGYGTLGYTPDQRWDWSGIRDSSDAAIDAMAKVAEDWYAERFGAGAIWPWDTDEAKRAVA